MLSPTTQSLCRLRYKLNNRVNLVYNQLQKKIFFPKSPENSCGPLRLLSDRYGGSCSSDNAACVPKAYSGVEVWLLFWNYTPVTDEWLTARPTAALFRHKHEPVPVNWTFHACSIQFQTQTGTHCKTVCGHPTECLNFRRRNITLIPWRIQIHDNPAHSVMTGD